MRLRGRGFQNIGPQNAFQSAQVFTCILFGGCTVSTLPLPDPTLSLPSRRSQVVSMCSEEEVGRVRTSPTNLRLVNADAPCPVGEGRKAQCPRS